MCLKKIIAVLKTQSVYIIFIECVKKLEIILRFVIHIDITFKTSADMRY